MNERSEVPVFGEREAGLDYVVRPAAYVVVIDEARRVACVDEASGLFLPGGGVEPGEAPEDAVRREVAEECACALEITAPLGTAVQFFRTVHGRAFELRASFFMGRFGALLDREPEDVMHWRSAGPEPPPLYHACHRWAVRRAWEEGIR